MSATDTRAPRTAPFGGAEGVRRARERMAAPPPPPVEPLPQTLDAVRQEQSALFSRQRKGGLSPREFARLTELGRLEMKLIADRQSNGKRLIGQRHKAR